ncbi:MAG: single-stranded DNA-binding protein [Candidatus Staskawiczbacteria bacterium]|nr:single-stranded DNA-binding protein [Candidatus Staskawiczbacteria bacterium]
MNLNKIFVLGNVTKDPEVRSMPNGGQVTSFSVATNRFYTSSAGEKKTEAEFHNVVCFGKLADISSRYLNKGGLVLIEGRIKTRNWQDSAGVKHYKTEIIADSLQLGPKGVGSTGGNSSSYAGGRPSHAPEPDTQRQEEIPVIEEDYTPPSTGSAEEQKTVSFEDESADEIDVKDIPF